jgi:hypothetical protein
VAFDRVRIVCKPEATVIRRKVPITLKISSNRDSECNDLIATVEWNYSDAVVHSPSHALGTCDRYEEIRPRAIEAALESMLKAIWSSWC